MKDPLLSATGLTVRFGSVCAVDNVSLELRKGETLGLVGESGSGKTTLGRTLLRLVEPDRGEVRFRGEKLSAKVGHWRRHMQMIFQDPYASLNPRMTAYNIIAEPIRFWRLRDADQVDDRVAELMDLVGLDCNLASRYPHQFSGGQRQRIGIARALATQPDFLVADEPIAALDVSIQAQILNLLIELRDRLGLTMLFVSHDLRAVHHIADRIAVMYLGRIVELGPGDQIYQRPLMPYTRSLISSLPSSAGRYRPALTGELPSPLHNLSGCRFRTRCAYEVDECSRTLPALTEIAPQHAAACLRINTTQPDIERSGPI